MRMLSRDAKNYLQFLKQHRLELIEEYYYWMCNTDDEEFLEEIEEDILKIERDIAMLEGDC